MPSLDQFTAGQREQEAIRALLQLNPRSLPQGVNGVIAENYDRRYVGAREALTSGRLMASVVMLFPGETVTGFVCSINGTSPDATFFRFGLFTADNVGGTSQGVRVFQSDNLPVLTTSNGLKYAASTSPVSYTVPGDDEPRPYYVACLCVASTMPTMSTVEFDSFLLADSLTGTPTPGLVLAGRQESLSFMPSALTFTAAYGLQPWIGLV